MSTGGSRWGITGNTEVSDGLSAVYKFETRLGDGAASQSTNQLYVGLSGGFGSLTMGKFHNAAYHSGGLRDTGYWFGGSDTKTKRGNTLSYAFSSEAASFQVDAIMDGRNTGQSVDEFQLGMSLSLGDIGKIGFGYENVEDESITKTVDVPGKMPEFEGIDGLTIGGLDGLTIGGTEGLSIVGADGLTVDGQLTIDGLDGLTIGGTVATTHSDVDIMGSGGRLVINEDGMLVWTALSADGDAPTWASEVQSDSITVSSHAASDADDAPAVMPVIRVSVDHETTGLIDGDSAIFTKSTDGDGNTVYRHVTCDDDGVSCTRNLVFAHETKDDLTVEQRLDILEGEDDPREATVNFVTQAVAHHTATGKSTSITGVDSSGLMVEGTEGLSIVGADGLTVDGQLTIDGLDGLTIEGTEGLTIEGTEDLMLTPGSFPTTKSMPDTKHGYTRAGVSAQFNAGGITLGLGYSEKESNKMGSMDEKTTYVGLSGSVGDTGLSWRSQFRDVTNSGNTKGDANPWMVGIHKSLGGGAFTFIEHENADDGKSGSTVIALGVNF